MPVTSSTIHEGISRDIDVVVQPSLSVPSNTSDDISPNSSLSTHTPLLYCHNLTLQEILANFTECLGPPPQELYFSDNNLFTVIAYCCLFVIAAVGNLTVFITLFRNRNMKSRINMFIMHLAIADLIVTFMMLPIEIAWHSTVAWLAGDAMCRFMMFFRALGFYLSSAILVSISLDRYFAIIKPLSNPGAGYRAKMMLVVSWILSVVASIPQVSSFNTFIYTVKYNSLYVCLFVCSG